MRYSASLLGVTAVVLSAVAIVSAKGPTVKLTIARPGVDGAVDVTTAAALVHVWSDDFIGVHASEPSRDLPRYEVSFHVLPRGERDSRVMYALTYVRDAAGAGGYVYLPGPEEEHYRLNVSTIERHGQNGRWHRAVDRWAEAMNESLSASGFAR